MKDKGILTVPEAGAASVEMVWALMYRTIALPRNLKSSHWILCLVRAELRVLVWLRGNDGRDGPLVFMPQGLDKCM